VDFTIGGVTVTGADGRSRPAAKGLELQSGDRIVTADGRAQLRFTDGAYVSVQPNSDFSIREYQFDGKTDGKEKGVFGLVRGALRTVTGAIGRVNRGAYQIQTPTATIGIRGTGGLIQVLPDGSTLVTGNSGVWSLGNQAGSVDVPAGKAAKAGPNQAIPPSESVEGPVLPPPGGSLEVRLVQAWDSLPSALPGLGPYAFVAGDLRRDEVGRRDVPEDAEPEGRELVQDLPLVRDPVRQDPVERADPVGGDDEEVIAEVVDVADLAPGHQRQGRETRLRERAVFVDHPLPLRLLHDAQLP